MDQHTVKYGAALVCFMIGLAGCLAAPYMSSLNPKWMQLCNAFAGGVLISSALVHMLSENAAEAEELGRWGKVSVNTTRRRLHGESEDERIFPVGYVMCGLGFFLVVSLEVLLGGHEHEQGSTRSVKGGLESSAEESETGSGSDDHETSEEDSINPHNPAHHPTKRMLIKQNVSMAGLSMLISISIHSVIEGTAAGSCDMMESLWAVIMAILAHKFFTGFAVGSALLGTVPLNMWRVCVVCFALASPLGIVVGMYLEESLEGPTTAALQCTCAGTLLGIGIGDMLMPALHDSAVWKGRAVLSAITAFLAMSLLGYWA